MTPLLESVDDIFAKPDPQWLVRHVVPVPGLTLLYGPSGQGKSFVALDWALSIATAQAWLGQYPIDTPGTVVYIACEGTGGLKRRIAAWLQHHPESPKPEDIAFCLKNVDLYDEEERQRLLDELTSIYPPETLFNVEEDEWVNLSRPLKLIVIDTVARVFQGDNENDNAQMGEFIQAIEEFATLHGAAVLLVHHSAKASAKNERGGGALRGAMDACYMCQGKQRNGRLAEITLTCNKMKDAEERTIEMEMVEYPLPALTRDEDGNIRHGGALFFVGAISGEGEPSIDSNNTEENTPELDTLAVLAKFPKGLTSTQWCVEAGVSRATFNRHRKALKDADRIRKNDVSGTWKAVSHGGETAK